MSADTLYDACQTALHRVREEGFGDGGVFYLHPEDFDTLISNPIHTELTGRPKINNRPAMLTHELERGEVAFADPEYARIYDAASARVSTSEMEEGA